MRSRDKSVLAVVVLLVLAIGGYFLVVAPKHHQANQLQSQIAAEQSQLNQAEAEVQSDLHAEGQYDTYLKQLKVIRTAVPSDEQIPELINQLQAASTRNKVGFESVSTSDSSPGAASADSTDASSSAFPSQSFNLSFTGNYFSVARLLGTLDEFVQADNTHFHATGRLISISTLSLSPGGASTSTSTASTGSGFVTAAVTALDYDVPTSLLSNSSTATSSSTSTSTASPAAYVTH